MKQTKVTPIRIAIASKCRTREINRLLTNHQITKEDDDDDNKNNKRGRTILHDAVLYHKRNPGVVLTILKYCPDLISVRDCDGRTPLHLCILSHARYNVFEVILRADPSQCSARDELSGATPLHLACLYASPKIALAILRSSSASQRKCLALAEMMNAKKNIRTTPLRLALRRKYFLPVVQELIRIDPGQIYALDKWGRTPLHEACTVPSNRFPWNDIQALFECLLPSSSAAAAATTTYSSPHADENEKEQTYSSYFTLVDTRRGMTPLMGALSSRKSTAVSKMLLHKNPSAASITDKRGRIPLIVACQQIPHSLCRHDAFIMELLRKYPAAAAARDRETGISALSAAVKSVRSISVITSILEEDASQMHNVDQFGRTPLFLSCLRGRCDRRWKYRDVVLSTLLTTFPDALSIPDQNGRTPLFAAIRGGRSWHIIRALVKYDPSILNHLDNKGRTALHFACAARTIPRELTLLEAIPPASTTQNDALLLQQLASVETPPMASLPDEDGRIPLNVALECGRGWDDGVRDIFQAAPQALGARDTKTGLFPALLAAVKRSSDRHDDNDDDNNNEDEEMILRASSTFGFPPLGSSRGMRPWMMGRNSADQRVTVFHLLLEDPTILSDGLKNL